jgi:hypothetical protein
LRRAQPLGSRQSVQAVQALAHPRDPLLPDLGYLPASADEIKSGDGEDTESPFTDSPPPAGARSPRGYRGTSEHLAMADFLVVAAIAVFVAAMLGLTWALGRI